MLEAARAKDWGRLSALEEQCAQQTRLVEAGPVPPLTGADRLRKVSLLTQILATDRAITEITEYWMSQLTMISQGKAKAPAQVAVAQH
jgi:hypothetical protein